MGIAACVAVNIFYTITRLVASDLTGDDELVAPSSTGEGLVT
jgi:hypothetical protein